LVDAQRQIEKFQEFFNSVYEKDISEFLRRGLRSIVVDFRELAKFDIELSEELLEDPEETIKAAELALQNFDVPAELNFRVRFVNLNESQGLKIRNIRGNHIKKFFAIEGIVRQASDVRPQVVSAKFECPSCGNNITILQLESSFREPSRCSCGRKGRFRLITKELVDSQRLVIEEAPEALEGGEQPKRLNVFLREDLVEPRMERKTTPGAKIRVIGIVKEVPIPSKSGGQSTLYDLALEANYIEPIEETYEDIDITTEDEKAIKELAKDPKIYEKLIGSIAPSIYGHENIKGALVLQLMGGIKKTKNDGTTTRGDVHILLVGDPGAAKSSMLTFIAKAAPKARYVAGRSVTGAGITASVVKDEFLKGWALEAGAIVLANKGILCLHPNTEVLFDNKIVKIESLFDKNRAKIGKQASEFIEYHDLIGEVPTFKIDEFSIAGGKSAKIRRKKYRGKILTLKFKSGFSLKLTPDHKVLDGSSMEWKDSQHFKIGEKVIAPLKLPDNKQRTQIIELIPDDWKLILDKKEKNEIKALILNKFSTISSFNKQFNLDKNILFGGKQFTVGQTKKILSYFGKYEDWKTRNLKFARKKKGEQLRISEVTPELGYVLGFIYGDGNIQVKKKNTRISVMQSLNHKSYIDQFVSFFDKVSYRSIHYVDSLKKSEIRGKKVKSFCRQMYFGSNLIGELFRVILGNDFSNLLKLDDETIRAFIAGVMDSDGCMGNKKSKDHLVQHVMFMFAPKNKIANLNFIMALRRLDCYGKISKQKKWNIVQITGRTDVEVLKNEIQKYSVKAKNLNIINRIKKLSSISQKLPAKRIAEICKQIANTYNKSILVDKGIWCTIYRFKEGQMEPSRDQLFKIKNELVLSSEISDSIEKIIKRDYFLDEIIDINEEDYIGYVYDLYVPNTNNFVANGVIVHNCLDEMDKMTEEDTSALHEAMAQQSYHPDTELTFADGSVRKIGEFVDNIIENNYHKVSKIEDCEVIGVNNIEVLTTDFKKIFPTKVNRVSRHKAPKKLVEIEYSNGRKITVTPEHPVFIYGDGIKEVSAIDVTEGMLCPAPRKLSTKEKNPILIKSLVNNMNKKITFIENVNQNFARLLGYVASEGHSYKNDEHRYAEIGISNTNPIINSDVNKLFSNIFNTYTNINIRNAETDDKANLDLTTTRLCSIPLYNFFYNNFNELTKKAPYKRVGDILRMIGRSYKLEFLKSAFKGDGLVDKNRIGYSTSSYGLAKDYQDLLLQNDIYGYIIRYKKEDKIYYKVIISGSESLIKFKELIVEEDDPRFNRIKKLVKTSSNKLNDRDIIPNSVLIELNLLLKQLRLSDGYFLNNIKRNQNAHRKKVVKYLKKIDNRIKECLSVLKTDKIKDIRKTFSIHVKNIADVFGISIESVYNYEIKNSKKLLTNIKKIAKEKLKELNLRLNKIKEIVFSDLRFVKVKKVNLIENKELKWVYDVTVEPTKTFISENLVLHNTISISKANIQATLRAETTLLAAANPKLGRFDPYQTIASQIDLPPALINRFDLIFPVRDMPNKDKDEKIATHVLAQHQDVNAAQPEISTDMLKKYVAYVRQRVVPKLTQAAIDEIKEFYVTLRNSGQVGDEGIRPIPISARQLEALVRLAEGSARVRLSTSVTKKDARNAIEILMQCLKEVGFDYETGQIDIDRIATGVPASTRNKIITVRDAITHLSSQGKKSIALEEIISEVTAKGISEAQVEEIIEKLKKEGTVYEPRRGFISLL